MPPNLRAAEIRGAEADAVADVCARLIGNVNIRGENGEFAPLTPGGIALLAPTGSELWRYERALEARGLPIASQAGKGLFRRQEVQDLVALVRTLGDVSATLAFGALMRGPLVGLTEEELLDITAALPPLADRPDAIPRLWLLTPTEHVAHPLAQRALTILQDLHRRAWSTSPALLLAEAVERLGVLPILRAREGDRSARAAANLEAVLELARPCGVKGLKRFARDLSRDWRLGTASEEGRVDAEADAIEIITLHSAHLRASLRAIAPGRFSRSLRLQSCLLSEPRKSQFLGRRGAGDQPDFLRGALTVLARDDGADLALGRAMISAVETHPLAVDRALAISSALYR